MKCFQLFSCIFFKLLFPFYDHRRQSRCHEPLNQPPHSNHSPVWLKCHKYKISGSFIYIYIFRIVRIELSRLIILYQQHIILCKCVFLNGHHLAADMCQTEIHNLLLEKKYYHQIDRAVKRVAFRATVKSNLMVSGRKLQQIGS